VGLVLLPFISLFSIIFFVLGIVMAVSSFKKELTLTAEGKEQQKALQDEISEVIEWLKQQPDYKAALVALEQRIGANIFLLPNEFDKEVKEIFKQVEKEVLEGQEKDDTSDDSLWWFTVYNTDYSNRSALFDFSDANNSDLDGAFDSAGDSSDGGSSSGDSGCSGCGGCGGD
jgi:uncharacterized membrane protein